MCFRESIKSRQYLNIIANPERRQKVREIIEDPQEFYSHKRNIGTRLHPPFFTRVRSLASDDLLGEKEERQEREVAETIKRKIDAERHFISRTPKGVSVHEFKRNMALQRKEEIEEMNHKRRVFMLHRWDYLRCLLYTSDAADE